MRICCYSSKLLFHNGVNVLISTGETLEIPVKTFKVLMLHVETNCHYVHSRSFAECPIKASNFKDHKIPITNFSPDCFIYADVLQLLHSQVLQGYRIVKLLLKTAIFGHVIRHHIKPINEISKLSKVIKLISTLHCNRCKWEATRSISINSSCGLL